MLYYRTLGSKHDDKPLMHAEKLGYVKNFPEVHVELVVHRKGYLFSSDSEVEQDIENSTLPPIRRLLFLSR